MRLLETLVATAFVVQFAVSAVAQNGAPDALAEEGYLTPPGSVAEVVLAPRHKNVTLSNLSPNGKVFLISLSGGLPLLTVYAKPFYNLGGLQIDPKADRARRSTLRASVGLRLFAWETGESVDVEIPESATVSGPTWSPDGSRLAFFANFDDSTHIYVADTLTGESRRITRTPVLATIVSSIEWTSDGQNVLTVLHADGRSGEPANNGVATTPKIQLTADPKNQLRTYPSLLQTPGDYALLEYYASGQLALINVVTGEVRRIGKPAMVRSVSAAPDGEYFRVTTMQKPFSRIVPVSSFGSLEEIWDINGEAKAEIRKRPLRDGSGPRQPPQDSDAKRSLTWRPDGAGMGFMQREPAKKKEEGEEAEQSEESEPQKRKDRVMQWLPPYDDESMTVVYESETSIGSVRYSEDCQVLFLTETAGGKEHLFAVFMSEPEKKYTIYEHKSDDFYMNPGRLMTKRSALGPTAVRISSDGKFVYLSGTQYAKDPQKEAPRPFVDKVEIMTGEKTRVFESSADVYERVLTVLDDDMNRAIISRESPEMTPDSYLRDMRSGEVRNLTDNVDYSPQITRLKRRNIQVTRVDGLKFWVRVTLPNNYTSGVRMPAMFWFYPREFTDQKAYDRSKRTFNKNRFPSVSPRSMDILALLGYVVVYPDCPIIGPSGRMNDNFVPDLRNSLSAVIDELDKSGTIDRERLGIGGHSYGAFGTANAMIHTPFFKAGIAGDGNYNRTLTPITFQSERRLLWEARETYFTMSPLFWAERLNGALLMYHGAEDQNTGTFPINSDRMFHALNGLGKTAALYVYPYEGHGPAARETVLDLWARWVAWLDKYVKNHGKEEKKEGGGG
ncbi:MAG: prolyl oligopeptidase family serine peptidase [Armatimonadetes bacterium]|nr:prolyl oligopeptidase family serine peptidase [Armatimonadota bacterium]